jgi:hypothetical protein
MSQNVVTRKALFFSENKTGILTGKPSQACVM